MNMFNNILSKAPLSNPFGKQEGGSQENVPNVDAASADVNSSNGNANQDPNAEAGGESTTQSGEFAEGFKLFQRERDQKNFIACS